MRAKTKKRAELSKLQRDRVWVQKLSDRCYNQAWAPKMNQAWARERGGGIQLERRLSSQSKSEICVCER